MVKLTKLTENIPKTSQEGIDMAIKNAVEDILYHINTGMSYSEAVKNAKEKFTLGIHSWTIVLQLVHKRMVNKRSIRF